MTNPNNQLFTLDPPTIAALAALASRLEISRSETVRRAIASLAAEHPARNRDDAKRLACARRKAGLTQPELAAELGLARTTIATFESGRRPLSPAVRVWVDQHAT